MQNELFKLTTQKARYLDDSKSRKINNLNYKDYVEESKKNERELEKYQVLTNFKSNLNFTSTPSDILLLKKDILFATKRQRWHDELANDIKIDEIVNILVDMKK